MIIISTERIKAILSGCYTEQQAAQKLRAHKVKYSFSTETGFFSIRIPCKSGIIRIYKTCSRSAPLLVRMEKPAPFRSVYPVLHCDY